MTPEEAVRFLVDYEALDNNGLPTFEESGIFPKGVDPILSGCPIASAIRWVAPSPGSLREPTRIKSGAGFRPRSGRGGQAAHRFNFVAYES